MRQQYKHTLRWPNSLKLGVFLFVSITVLVILIVLKSMSGG
jgi:hypothetical protein